MMLPVVRRATGYRRTRSRRTCLYPASRLVGIRTVDALAGFVLSTIDDDLDDAVLGSDP
jgi:hypothetical protein